MTYRLDDEGAFLDAAVNAGNEAYGACVRAGQHCAHQMTDGVFSRAIAILIASDAVWEKAIEAGLVERMGNGELRVVDFLQWNPSAKESKKLRKARSEAGKRGGKSSSKPQASASASAQAKPQASAQQRGEGIGSDLGLGGDARGTMSAEALAVANAVRKYPILRPIHWEADTIGEVHAGHMVATGFKLEWALEAIDACAAKASGDMPGDRMKSYLVTFLRNKPKPPPASGVRLTDNRRPIVQSDEGANRAWKMPEAKTS